MNTINLQKGSGRKKQALTKKQQADKIKQIKEYRKKYYLEVIKPKREAERKAKEEQAKKEAEEKAKKEAEEKARREAEEHAIENLISVVDNFKKGNEIIKTIDLTDAKKNLDNQKIIKEIVNNLVVNDKDKYLITTDNKHYITLNETNYLNLLNKLDNIEEEEQTDSFWTFYKSCKSSKSISIKKLDPYAKYQFNRKGGFFKYTNKTNINLEKYGIFKEFLEENYINNCLYDAFKNLGMEEHILNELNISLKNRLIPINDLDEIAKKYNLCLTIKYDYTTGRTEKKIFNKDGKTKYNLGLLDEHYFILEDTIYTAYSIQNYDILYSEYEFNKIYYKKDKVIKRANNRFIDSFDLIKILITNKDKYLEEITPNLEILGNKFYSKSPNFDNLEYNKDYLLNHNEIKPNTKKNDDDYLNVFFDIETTIKGTHTPYLICSIDDNNNKLEFNIMKNDNENFIYYWLCSLKQNSRLIAHNASYDYKFIYKYLTNINNEILKGSNLIYVSAIFHNKFTKQNIKIQIINTLNLIPMKLKDFTGAFNLECKKEIINYKFYTEENIKKVFCPVADFIKDFSNEEKEIFYNNLLISPIGLINDDKDFNIIEYAIKYCFMDCQLLKDGYNKFKKDIKTSINLNLDDYLTLPNMAHNALLNNNCFDECYYLSGIPQNYISKCIVGGRSMSANNQKLHIKNKIVCLDAISLYPSAMYQMKGFLKGLPKVLKPENRNLDFLKEQDGYFIRIKINKVNKRLNMPLLNSIGEDETRIFSNDLENKIIFVGHYALEDLIKFQNIEFEIIDGYYFNEGFNNTIKDIVNKYYLERKNLKKENNPKELVYKLLLNSSYGRTILKPITTHNKIITKKGGYEKYLNRHFDEIKDIFLISGDEESEYTTYKIQLLKNILEHKNAPHIGVDILDYSKRIMNKVICLAESLNIPIFYQDTDSIHLLESDLNKLENAYFKEYQKSLLGDDLGQFKSDFKDWTIENKLINIHSKELLILAKKAYIDVLEGTDKETGETLIKYHYRLKGINEPSIIAKCKELNINELELFKRMYNGEEMEFNLSASGTQFKFNKNYTIDTNDNFKRTIKY